MVLALKVKHIHQNGSWEGFFLTTNVTEFRVCSSQLLLKCETEPSFNWLYKELQLLYFWYFATETNPIQEQETKLNTGNWIQGILLVLSGPQTV